MDIKRGFVDLPHGQVHYRTAGPAAGSNVPLLALHASPGSSRQLVNLVRGMGESRTVFAPDTPGNGDSVPLSDAEPTIADLAAAALRFMDAAGIESTAVYGSHTGAAIATELAILAPDRISHVIIDGISWLTPEELEEMLAHYAHPFTPDLDGSYLIRLFQFCRDQYLFFPWYNRTNAGRREGGLGSAQDLHAWVTEVMKASETYHRNYHAAFKYDARLRLRLLGMPVLAVAASNDPLLAITQELIGTVPDGRFAVLPRFDAPEFTTERKAAITAFLAASVSA
ncbi:MAG TPA: alpha/beta fold hydrolase [Sphingobium sp.]